MTPEEAAIRARDAAAPKTGNGITKQYGRGEGSRAVRDRRELIALLDPSTQVIVTRETLAAALRDADTHLCDDCGGVVAWSDRTADALMAALTSAEGGEK